MKTDTTSGKGSELTNRHMKTLSERNFRKAEHIFQQLYCHVMGIPDEGKTEPVVMTSAQVSSAKLFLEKIMPNLKNIDIDELIHGKPEEKQLSHGEILDAFEKMFISNSSFITDLSRTSPEVYEIIMGISKDLEAHPPMK